MKSKMFSLYLPVPMNEQIELFINRVNENKYQNVSKSQFVRDCIEYVLRKIEDDDISLYF